MAEKSKVTEARTYFIYPTGSETKLTINFLDEFDSKDFQRRMEEFIKFHLQKKHGKKDTAEMTKVRHAKKSIIKKTELPDFDYFKTTSSKVLREVIIDVLDSMPELLNLSTKQLEINIDIIGKGQRDYYASHEEQKSTPSQIFLELSGDVLVGRIVAPKYFVGKPNFRFLEKLLLHEFRHQFELLRGVYKREYEKYDKLKKDMISRYKTANVGRLALHTALCNLLSEGIAEYYVLRRTNKMSINMDWIRGFRENMKKLALIQNEQEALNYMSENLDDTTGPTVYYCGKIMCFFIGLEEAKKKGEADKIKIYANKQKNDLSKISQIMGSNKKFTIDQLPTASFKTTIELLNKTYYYKKFIKKYESACKSMGIDEKNMVISPEILAEIRKESKECFTKNLAAGKPPKVSRLHLLKERIKHLLHYADKQIEVKEKKEESQAKQTEEKKEEKTKPAEKEKTEKKPETEKEKKESQPKQSEEKKEEKTKPAEKEKTEKKESQAKQAETKEQKENCPQEKK